MTAGRRRITLRTRLVLGNLLLVVTALGVTWTIVAVSGPPLFRRYVEQVRPLPADVLDRAEAAFHVVNLVEVVLAVTIAFLLTVALSVLVTRPIGRAVAAMAAAAGRLSTGDYTARLATHPTIDEFTALATAINSMAGTIQQTEATRRRMLADLAHELRTPLATIDGYLEAIQDGIETADAPTLAILRNQVRKLTALAGDISAISAAEEGRLHLALRPTSLNTVIDDATGALQPAYAAKDVALTVEARAEVQVNGDPVRLEQVITNLLTNALRHTPAAGRVAVELTADTAGAHIRVTDTGVGIPAHHLPHVFERFYRAHPDSHGSGIGLTISRAVITAHAGTITISSAGPGQGTTADITLPR
ncbi:sensor histidine kinase [Dactylosporangium matsuzakiense]|uniref:histidine kinase n=1 Tax=Dactylosporangium matsuzakiense TaxID=53360 RepID=A0A9W6NS62_9ACTN|nr:HAMP domain-containing sensor histidine kinase [Dactylosporangium matsuzakiense]UWZ42284.1 HAMP domain-containing histidine kinase [Dactylosporangium matsuzakiense]GLL07289.1 putative sensor histidine kinase [Dactylosporangium matsuzakiense]